MSDDLDAQAARLRNRAGAPGEGEQRSPDAVIAFGANSQMGDVSLGDVAGRDVVKVGITLARVIYGRDPDEGEHKRLTSYLARLAARQRRLPLGALAAGLDEGEGLALERVYTPLATLGTVPLAQGARSSLRRYYADDGFQQPAPAHDPARAMPADAWVASQALGGGPDDPRVVLLRSLLPSEAAYQQRRIVLLADPGGGKSTFLRHLAWALAQRGLDQANALHTLPGWAGETPLLPALLPLRRLAAHVARVEASPLALAVALAEELEQEYGVLGAAGLLDNALTTESAMLLLDGLDEVPLTATPSSADRRTVLQAVRSFADLHPQLRIVITCRTRAFGESLRRFLGWPVEALAPLTLGQIRHFVSAWFAAIAAHPSASQKDMERHRHELIAMIAGSERLQQLAATPLLLTMIILARSQPGELPRDRAMLYEMITGQLLDVWDRQSGGATLADAIGAPELRSDELRPMLDQLAFAAQSGEATADGRGRLPTNDLHLALTRFLVARRVAGAWEAAGRCLAHFNDRSGLLAPGEGGLSYAFAHLTLQEHGAGRHLLLQPGAVRAVMERRTDDRWREPIALGLGVLQHLHPEQGDRIFRIFRELLDADEDGEPKPLTRWYRDLILAAELAQERDWERLRKLFSVESLRRDLRRGLVRLLADGSQPLPIAERVRAAFLLGDLGDPRFPVSTESWQREIARAEAQDPAGYFCPLPLEGARRWLGRYPITNEQLRAWPRAAREHSWRREADPNFNRPNQPAAGVSWELAAAFCTWLSQQVARTVRLPREAEWEAAARGHDRRLYPWGNKRQRDRAAAKEDHDLRGWPFTVPVGCYPAGASAVGALDMAGNIWEWTADVWQPDSAEAQRMVAQPPRVLRGGGYLSKRRHTLATARIGLMPGASFDNGFRVLLELDELVDDSEKALDLRDVAQ
jgi:hypothetical protein